MDNVEAVAAAVRTAISATERVRALLEQTANEAGPLAEARDHYAELFRMTELEQLGVQIDEQRAALANLVALLGRAQRDLEG